MRNKKGLSPIITTILLVALVIAVVGVVWVVVSNLVKGGIGGAESCFGIVGKVTLNPAYTCFESGTDSNVTFSITRTDIDMDSLFISISGQGGIIKSFVLNSTSQTLSDLVNYHPTAASRTTGTAFPGKNQGKTYVYNGSLFSSAPDRVELAITVGGNSCGTVDSIEEISNC